MKRPSLSLALPLAILLTALAATAQTPPPTKPRVPPPGVAIPDADRKELETGAAALRAEIDGLARNQALKPELRALLPDIEIFHKAVDWALRYDEFFNEKQVATAKALLAEGTSRAKALHSGQAPWTAATGLVIRGYRSRIDGSAQPYGVIVPDTWKAGDRRPRRLMFFNHGRGENLTELAFIGDRMKSKGDLVPSDTFIVHPYGRFCNATKFAGETDVFEAWQHAVANYPIDPNRVEMTGFSMGGASVWHLATHYAGLWAAASPGAGFAETQIYTKALAPGKEPPAWYEQVLWRLYNATDYAADLFNCPLLAYSGEIDPQKQSADLMEKAATAEGVQIERFIGPNTAHKYEPETKKALLKRLDELAVKGREEVPAKVRLATYTLRYNRQEWVEVDAMERHWERADVTAEIADEGTIKVSTKNVAALTLDMRASAVPLDKTRPPRVQIDGQDLAGPPVTSPWTAHFRKENGKWAAVKSVDDAQTGLRKRHGLQGPIDDAFYDSFVFVRPTGKPLNETVGAWVKSEMDRAIPQWRTVFRGDARVIDDKAVTPDVLANANLVLWGDPSSNAILAKILPQLPLKWDAFSVKLGADSGPAANHVPVMIYPNPLNPKRYVVINSSFTFRQGSNASNATQTPKLPDWAIVDLKTPASMAAPGGITAAGFFGERWEITDNSALKKSVETPSKP